MKDWFKDFRPPRSSTETLVGALRVLADQIQAPDDVPSTCLREAASRLDELAEDRSKLVEAVEVARSFVGLHGPVGATPDSAKLTENYLTETLSEVRREKR